MEAEKKMNPVFRTSGNTAIRDLILLFLILLFLVIPTRERAQAQTQQNIPFPITLHLDGKEHQLRNPLILKDGVTFAPFREVFTLLGGEIGYTSKYGRLLVWAELEGHHFLLEKGTPAFYHNNVLLSLPGVPPLRERTFYFPLRFLLDRAGYRLHWETGPRGNNGEPARADIYLQRPSPRQMVEAEVIEHTGEGNGDNGGSGENGGSGDANSAGDQKAPLQARFSPQAHRVPVLMYHHLLPEAEYDGSSGTIISAEAFAEQMEYLFANGYRTVTLEDLYLFITGQKELPPKSVVLTFDDGYASNYDYACPRMKQFHFRAVQFPLTACIEKTTCWVPRMTWEMMADSADVFEFHSHSHNLHYYIGDRQALLAVSPEQALEDLRHSRELLDCFAFAYPFGAFNEETIKMLKDTGYKMAFTIRPGYVYPGDDLYRLKRLGVYPETKLEDFIRLLENFE